MTDATLIAQTAVSPQPAGNVMSSIAHTLVPPPYKQDVPHPPAQHNISTMNELVLEGKVCSTGLVCPEDIDAPVWQAQAHVPAFRLGHSAMTIGHAMRTLHDSRGVVAKARIRD